MAASSCLLTDTRIPIPGTPPEKCSSAAYGDSVPWWGWVGEAEAVRKRAEESAAAGTSEILYTPAGDDLLGQAETFFRAVESVKG